MYLRRDVGRPANQEANRRASGRIHVSHDVRCNLGSVVDLSATGARLLSSKAQCGCVTLAILAPETQVQLPAEIVWSRRVGFRQHLLGVHFLEVDSHAASALSRIAGAYRPCRAA